MRQTTPPTLARRIWPERTTALLIFARRISPVYQKPKLARRIWPVRTTVLLIFARRILPEHQTHTLARKIWPVRKTASLKFARDYQRAYGARPLDGPAPANQPVGSIKGLRNNLVTQISAA